MTLTDIIELKERLLVCKDFQEAAAILDECGEDSDVTTAKKVFSSVRSTDTNIFYVSDGEALFLGSAIKCPCCGNTSPDKLLSSSAELLSDDPGAHFGCCECGEQFTLMQ